MESLDRKGERSDWITRFLVEKKREGGEEEGAEGWDWESAHSGC